MFVRFRAALVALLGLFASPALAQVPNHAPWDTLLQTYVRESADGINRFNYRGLANSPADRQALDRYIASLEGTAPSRLNRADQFAFWANLYNAVTIDVVVERYPVRSIRDIKPHPLAIGPWGVPRVTVEGRRLSLDAIEHEIMRPTFADPRVHYAVNCASIGCPNLQRQAFRGATLEAQLDAAARAFINHPRAVQVTPRGLRLNSIYQWFRVDFGTEAQLRTHLQRYAAPGLAAQIAASPRIAGYGYDWSLNDSGPR
jgi:hypothetical protein